MEIDGEAAGTSQVRAVEEAVRKQKAEEEDIVTSE